MATMNARSPHWLVQRMNHRPTALDQPVSGLNTCFRLQYMGSSEFEVGEQAASLKRIRAAGVAKVFCLDGYGPEVFFITTEDDAGPQFDELMDWVTAPGRIWSLEDPYFREHLTGGRMSLWAMPTDAWWSLTGDVAWALDLQVALDLAAAFNSPPK